MADGTPLTIFLAPYLRVNTMNSVHAQIGGIGLVISLRSWIVAKAQESQKPVDEYMKVCSQLGLHHLVIIHNQGSVC